LPCGLIQGATYKGQGFHTSYTVKVIGLPQNEMYFKICACCETVALNNLQGREKEIGELNDWHIDNLQKRPIIYPE
jgi:hypothetical protein